jgi:hypothetical protein
VSSNLNLAGTEPDRLCAQVQIAAAGLFGQALDVAREGLFLIEWCAIFCCNPSNGPIVHNTTMKFPSRCELDIDRPIVRAEAGDAPQAGVLAEEVPQRVESGSGF